MISANHSDGPFSLHVGTPGQGMFKLQGEKGNQQWALKTIDDLKIAMFFKNHSIKQNASGFADIRNFLLWEIMLKKCQQVNRTSPPRKQDRNYWRRTVETVEILSHYKTVLTEIVLIDLVIILVGFTENTNETHLVLLSLKRQGF